MVEPIKPTEITIVVGLIVTVFIVVSAFFYLAPYIFHCDSEQALMVAFEGNVTKQEVYDTLNITNVSVDWIQCRGTEDQPGYIAQVTVPEERIEYYRDMISELPGVLRVTVEKEDCC